MNQETEFQTGFLFSTPTFFGGAGTVINLAGNYYEFNETTNPDEIAMQNDFRIVGSDLRKALSQEDHLCESV